MKGIATSPLHSRGSPKRATKLRIGCLTPAFSGAHSWAELLNHPCILGSPTQRGQNQTLLPHTFALSGGQKRVELLCHHYILGHPHNWGQNRKWLPHSCLLGGTQVGRIATSPLHSRGSPTKGTNRNWLPHPCLLEGPTSARNSYITAAFSGLPNKGDKFRIGCLSRAFSGAHK